jgi:hypothetical protein
MLLCGGLVQTGHQCGMLWGSAMGAGAESFSRYKNKYKATGMAIIASQEILKSYKRRTDAHDCRVVTGCDFTKPFGLVKYLILGKTFTCRNLGGNWAPEAVQSVNSGLNENNNIPKGCKSCASEVAIKMGASEEESVLVSGFAGGIGLSGNACGALGAAIWIKTITWMRNNPGKNPPYFNNPEARKTLKTFRKATNSEMLCKFITGKQFTSLEQHTAFIDSGGCSKLIDVLAQA